MDNAEFPQKSEVIEYVVDLMVLMRTITNIPGTHEELTLQLIRLLPTGYKRVDIVADTYREVSIKDPERRKRGCADKVLIQSAKSKVPRNFNEFLQNGENKTRLIDLILTVILERKLEVLSSLNSEDIYFLLMVNVIRLTEMMLLMFQNCPVTKTCSPCFKFC